MTCCTCPILNGQTFRNLECPEHGDPGRMRPAAPAPAVERINDVPAREPRRRATRGRELPGHRPGVMNSTEAKYAAILEARLQAGEVLAYAFESVKVRIAPRSWWTPDFAVWLRDGSVEFVDVKGGRPEEQAQRVKIKVAADRYPLWRFVVARKRRRQEGGGFKREVVA